MKTKSKNLFSGALYGIKVLDISNFLAGPVSSMFLGDYGAEVIKVEKPGLGDEIRYWGNNKNGVGLMYKLINRNKKSITADLRTKFGVKIIKKLVKNTDIIIENYRKGTLEKWGLGYEKLSKINPGFESFTFSRASLPFTAARTLKSFVSRLFLSISLVVSSSSTIKIV